MPDKNLNKNPFTVDTGKGFSVYYKDRFLYSKKSPNRVINSLVGSLNIQSKSLVIYASPVLGYGLHELIKKLPNDSFLLVLEYDKELGLFFEYNFWNSFKEQLAKKNIFYICSTEINIVLQEIEKKTGYAFTKVIKIEASGGAGLYENFYAETEAYIQQAVSVFWKNRLTLIALGGSYARNIFKNYKTIPDKSEKYKILKPAFNNKPVFVAGAGPSLDTSLSFIKKNRRNIFLLAVDAALSALMPDIIPDAVVILETQFWIQNSFIGFSGKKIPVFADITANPNAVSALDGQVFFFFTEYSKTNFLKRFYEKGILPPSFLPAGSVGLSALQLAVFISENNTPIFHSGLDFSWKMEYSHAKKALQSKSVLNSVSKVESIYRTDCVFPNGFERQKGKNGEYLFTTHALQSYAEIYKKMFAGNPIIFDLGRQGLLISSNEISESIAEKIIDNLTAENLQEHQGIKVPEQIKNNFFENFKQQQNFGYIENPCNNEKKENTCFGFTWDLLKINNFFNAERETLLLLKNNLTGKKEFDKESVLDILKNCDYLYLHFPDAVKPDLLNKNFLKRVRIELEYFLKIISP